MFKKAFSLSEVLIVVSIIGIVAILTVPGLVNNYEDEKTVVQLRKIHNDLNSSYKQVLLKYGEYENWSTVNDTEKIKRYYEFLDTIRIGCDVKFPLATYNGSSYSKCELKDGTLLSASTSNSSIIYVALDGINGDILGANIFAFNVMPEQDAIRPMGYGYDKQSNGALYFPSNVYLAMFGTNWAIANGNLDYLKCLGSLNWNSKLSCK